MTILDQIISDKKLEVKARKEVVTEDHLQKQVAGMAKGRSLKQALIESPTGIISEFKRKSPSKGYIHLDANVEDVVGAYQTSGCAGVSVLTDFHHFGGTVGDFRKARAILDVPMIRKDFIIDPYQVYESKLLGADVILLIASALTLDEVYDLGALAHELGMETLLEIHDAIELEYINRYTDMVGVNNRNLGTFVTDVQVSLNLIHQIPASYVKVSESGIGNPQTVFKLREAGYQGFLMGENFMKEKYPGISLSQFIQALNKLK